MSKHHRNRNWAPAPQPLPEDAHVIDNHTHVASVVPFSQAMSHEAMEKGQGEVPVYSVDELLEQAQKVGVEGVIDCGCELPNLMTAIDMAREHPGTVHAAIAIHPNEAVLHGHRGAPGPDGLPIKYKPWHDIPFDEAMASYKGNDGIRESAKLVGMSHVMVETDAPYLSPMPYRGRTNAPYMIPYTLQALADYLDRPLAEIAKATRETTREVYGI